MKNTKILLNKATFLPESLNSVLIGIMLGDGGIYRSSSTSNSRFEMSFGQHSQQFAEKIGDLFKDYMSNPVKAVKLEVKNKINQICDLVASNFSWAFGPQKS